MSEDSKPSEISQPKRETSIADLAAALGIALLGVCLGAGSFGIPLGVGYDRIGPRFFPSLVAAGLVALGVWLAAAALRSGKAKLARVDSAEVSDSTNWRALGYLAAALLISLALLERGGFVIASSALFWTAARGFGSRRALRDAAIALVLSILVYVAFTQGLGLTLPMGIVEGLL